MLEGTNVSVQTSIGRCTPNLLPSSSKVHRQQNSILVKQQPQEQEESNQQMAFSESDVEREDMLSLEMGQPPLEGNPQHPVCISPA